MTLHCPESGYHLSETPNDLTFIPSFATSTMLMFNLLFLMLSFSGLSIGATLPPSSSQSSSLEQSPSHPRYTKKEATKIFRNSTRKWNRDDQKWKDCMDCKNGNPNVKLADLLEKNIKKQKDKISHVMENHDFDQSSLSKNQEKRYKYAQKKAGKKLDNYTDDLIHRKLVRHSKTGESSSLG